MTSLMRLLRMLTRPTYIILAALMLLSGGVVHSATLSDVQNQVFTASCTSCHSGSSPSQGLNLSAGAAYGNTVNVPSTEVVSLDLVEPGDADNSYLMQKLEGTAQSGATMPNGSPMLSTTLRQLVRDWIDAGAQKDAADTDGDGTEDDSDNCASLANADQLDIDSDGLGNACDADDDGDGAFDALEADLVVRGSLWSYLDDASDQGSAWRQVGFDDSSWSSGAGELGFNEGDEATLISDSDANTYYFRHEFTTDLSSSDLSALTLSLEVDDGAVVYLNGTEVHRTAMPTGTITYASQSTSDGADPAGYTATSIAMGSLISSADPSRVLVSKGATWSYLDDATDQGTAWQAASFDDSSWSTGPAELGFTEGDEATLIQSGATTYYFRHSFSVADLGDISALTVNLKRDDGAIVYLNGTEVARDGLAAGTIGAGDYASNASDDGNNFHPFTVDASLLLAGDATPTTEALIARKADWSYLDDGSDQGTGWTASDFDDSGWSTGAAELGFTEGDENTVITSGHVTYYFRHTFTVADISDITALCMKTQRDDGCVIHLNGTEVARSLNMGDGVITYATTSGDAGSESTSYMYDVALDGLVAGENVVAVEVHQSSAGSSDVSFDPEFIASRTATAENVLAVEVHQVSATSSDVSFDAELVATTSGTNVIAVEVHQNQTASSDVSFDAGLSATTIARSDLSSGTLEVAVVDGDNNVTWGAIGDPTVANGVETRYQYGPATSFNGGEGLDYHDRSMYFTTKNDNRVYQYDIDNDTMTIIYDQTTDLNGGLASGLDNLEMSPAGEVIIAEDGGNMELVAIANDYVVPIVRVIGHSSSEMTGPAFTSDMTRLYFSSQRGSTGDSADGVTYEITGPFAE
ncbi:uncharacterized protein METZ01_LOCUS37214 [marine metagenome]|uniref:Cytochrome c domain-containing protein n=1 Tax=marine metagenome TaxID=408172 RepID=A0A381QYY4_9ZZZZ